MNYYFILKFLVVFPFYHFNICALFSCKVVTMMLNQNLQRRIQKRQERLTLLSLWIHINWIRL